MDLEAEQRLPWLDRMFRSPVAQWAVLLCSAVFLGLAGLGVINQERVKTARAALMPPVTRPYDTKILPLPSDESLLAIATAPSENKPLSPESAELENARLPYSREPLLIARPYVFNRADEEQFTRARDCLAAAIYYEAGHESVSGRQAVAQIVLNRVRHPAYPHSICGVVFQGSERATGCQFTFTCDGAIARAPTGPALDAALSLAESALTGLVEPSVGWSTHYHTRWVLPYWAPTLGKTVLIGAHYFYRIPGRLSAPERFVASEEPEPLIRAVAPFGARAAALRPVSSVAVPPDVVEGLFREELAGAGAAVTLPAPAAPVEAVTVLPATRGEVLPASSSSPDVRPRAEPPRRRRGALPM